MSRSPNPSPAEPSERPSPGPVCFSAVLQPHRSLSPDGFRRLMAVLAALSLGLGIAFYVNGAWPVVGLLGLDVLLLWLAFRASYRDGGLYETVELRPEALTVRRVDPRGGSREFVFHPFWLRVEMDDPARHDSHVILSSHGRAVMVGSFLAPEERLDFSKALRRALDDLRRRPAAGD